MSLPCQMCIDVLSQQGTAFTHSTGTKQADTKQSAIAPFFGCTTKNSCNPYAIGLLDYFSLQQNKRDRTFLDLHSRKCL
ncbi:hypothetical protein [Nostoc sp.]|uniref:hypothetical protein n=1 Tax=Nostoc sp. TaxID=1180 RepID=UPI002FFA17DA